MHYNNFYHLVIVVILISVYFVQFVCSCVSRKTFSQKFDIDFAQRETERDRESEWRTWTCIIYRRLLLLRGGEETGRLLIKLVTRFSEFFVFSSTFRSISVDCSFDMIRECVCCVWASGAHFLDRPRNFSNFSARSVEGGPKLPPFVSLKNLTFISHSTHEQ